MNALAALSEGVSVLGWCLLHFVWQAAAIGAVYAFARLVLPRGNPRYLAAMLALVAMAACPIATGVRGFSLVSTPVELTGIAVKVSPAAAVTSHSAATAISWRLLLAKLLPWLVLAWTIGAGLLGVRVYRQWRGLRRMLAAAERLPEWQARARQFAQRLGLRRMVPVLASVRVATPTLVGWVKPAVVLPLAVLARMPPAQIDLILAHELAHLKRLDHIANLFQVMLETLFFYHPAVHWISREARNERELCCDTLALRLTGGERRDFVAALAGLEEFRAGHDLALAASGGILVERAWFIAGDLPRHKSLHLRGMAVAGVVALLLGLGSTAWRGFAWQQRADALVAANDASVMRNVRREALHPLALSSLPLASSDLLPVLPAVITAPPDTGTIVAPVVRIAPVARSGLSLVGITPRVMQVSMPDLESPAPPAAVAPRVTHAVPPVYTDQALLAGMQGKVVVEFTLDAYGAPQDLAVVTPGSGPLDVAALQALAQWRFAPPAVVGLRYRQVFTFKLGEDASNDAAAARPCMVTTGTHICRHVSDVDYGVQVSRPNG